MNGKEATAASVIGIAICAMIAFATKSCNDYNAKRLEIVKDVVGKGCIYIDNSAASNNGTVICPPGVKPPDPK